MTGEQHWCICLGYESLVIPLDLFLNGKKILVISNRDDILKFCEYMGLPCIRLEMLGFPDLAFNIGQIIDEIRRIFDSKITDKTYLHFTTKRFDLCLLTVAIYNKNIPIIFHETELDMEQELKISFWSEYNSLKRNIANVLRLNLYRFLINLKSDMRLTFRDYINGLHPFVTRDSLIKMGVTFQKYENKHQFFRNVYQKFNFGLGSMKYLFIDTEKSELTQFIKKDSIDRLYDVLRSVGIPFKYHPNRGHIIQNAFDPPVFFPAEILVNSVEHSLIGIVSAVFRYSEGLNIKSISCIELLEWKNKSKKLYYKDFIDSLNRKVLYPESYKELFQLVGIEDPNES